MLNPQSPIPLYHQLAEIIQTRIRSGEYSPGSRIPSENALSKKYGIGRPTVRQAIDLLVRKQMLTRRRGSGTYVAVIKDDVDLFSLAGTTSAFHKKGISVKTQILQDTRLKIIPDDPDNPFGGKQAYFLSRVTKVEGEAILVEDIYLHEEIFSGIDEVDLSDKSLAGVVKERFYLKPYGGRQNFCIAYVDGQRASALGVRKTEPILMARRFLNFPQADNAVYSELFCKTDRFVFSQKLGGITDEQ